VADDDDPGAEPLDGRDDIVGVRVERERRRVGRLGPEVVAQVEGMPLPAATGEVAEVALPQPRAGQLAVEEQERSPAGPSLGQPRLDVQSALGELDLVLADGSTAGGRRGARSSGEARGESASPLEPGKASGITSGMLHLGSGLVRVRSAGLAPWAYHSWGLMTRPVTGLG
jgi:hypothetical protein